MEEQKADDMSKMQNSIAKTLAKHFQWYDKYIDIKDSSLGCCRSDRSWACIVLGVIGLSLTGGAMLGLVFLKTPVLYYFREAKFVPPEPVYVLDRLWPGIRYDFYTQEPQSYDMAKRICEARNATLLTFDTMERTPEETTFDCYLRARGNAYERRFKFWMGPRVLYGNGIAQFESEQRPTGPTMTSNYTKWSESNGCDHLRHASNDMEKILADVNSPMNASMVVYNLVKRFDNYGTRKEDNEKGCWHLVRFDEAAKQKYDFICRAKLEPGALLVSTDVPANFYKTYCVFNQEYLSFLYRMNKFAEGMQEMMKNLFGIGK